MRPTRAAAERRLVVAVMAKANAAGAGKTLAEWERPYYQAGMLGRELTLYQSDTVRALLETVFEWGVAAGLREGREEVSRAWREAEGNPPPLGAEPPSPRPDGTGEACWNLPSLSSETPPPSGE